MTINKTELTAEEQKKILDLISDETKTEEEILAEFEALPEGLRIKAEIFFSSIFNVNENSQETS